MNKIILKYELDLDFILIAVTSSLRDYQLCFHINRSTGLDFSKKEDHEVWINNNTSHFFTKYSYISSTEETEFYLIGNKGFDGGLLIPEMKLTDYFILIKEFIDEEDLRILLEGINRIEGIVVATEIDVEKLKSKENLVF